MKRLRRLIPRTLLLVGIASVGAAWPDAMQTAAATEPGWLTAPGGFPLFDLTGIAPGDGGSATLTVTNPQPFPVKFSMAVTALHDDDNGCNEPELAIGDTTCGSGGGELQFDLRLTLATTGGTGTPIASGTVAEWATQPAVDSVSLGAREARTYRIGYELPISSSNLTQSDRVAFKFELRLDQELDSGVLASEAPTALIEATPSLPGAGTDVGAITLIGLSVCVTGLGLHKLSLHRRELA